MDLDELSVGVVRALLVQRRLRRSRTHHRVRGLAEDGADAACSDNDRFGGKDDDFHAAQVHGADAAADAVLVDDARKELPALVLGNLALGLVAAYLLVQRIQKLLSSGGAGESRAIVERPAETYSVQIVVSAQF